MLQAFVHRYNTKTQAQSTRKPASRSQSRPSPPPTAPWPAPSPRPFFASSQIKNSYTASKYLLATSNTRWSPSTSLGFWPRPFAGSQARGVHTDALIHFEQQLNAHWDEKLLHIPTPALPLVALEVRTDKPSILMTHALQLDVTELYIHAIFQSKPKGDSYLTRISPSGPHLVVLVWKASPTDPESVEHGVLANIVYAAPLETPSTVHRCFVYPIRRVVCNKFDMNQLELNFPLVEVSDVAEDTTDVEKNREILACGGLMTEYAFKVLKTELAHQPKARFDLAEGVVSPTSKWTRQSMELIKNNAEFAARVLLTAIESSERFQSAGGAEQAILEFGQALLLSKSKLERYQMLIKMWTDIQTRDHAAGEITRAVDKRTKMLNDKAAALEQVRVLREKLGVVVDTKKKFEADIQDLVKAHPPPEVVQTIIQDQLVRRGFLTSVTNWADRKHWVKYLANMPWGVMTEDTYDVNQAQSVLNADHFGLEDAKERILQFIAVCQQSKQIPDGKTILLVGPPGTGKTSITESIAKALGRKFIRISAVTRDPHDIRGFRRTYTSAQPGNLAEAIRRAGSFNPVIVLDEIDKISSDPHRGDPAAALLEVLDPKQNKAFVDHYMDVPLDLSKVLFIATANTTDTIPPALLDRMQVVKVSGYVPLEKLSILNGFIWPRLKNQIPLDVNLTDDAKKALVEQYSRENGVRQLQRYAEQIFHKLGLKHTKGQLTQPVVVRQEDLQQYCGVPPKVLDPVYETLPVGVVTGLAYLSNFSCGSAMMIETIVDKLSTTPKLCITGNLADVMKESAQIAFVFAKNFVAKHFPDNKVLEKSSLHMHFPSGAVSKDGPSAGITIATSLISIALNQPVSNSIAMTGEITLYGRVLPIGGVRDKTVAAKQRNCKEIVLPAENKAHWDELPKYIKEGIKPIFASRYEDVFSVVFGKLSSWPTAGTQPPASTVTPTTGHTLSTPTRSRRTPRSPPGPGDVIVDVPPIVSTPPK